MTTSLPTTDDPSVSFRAASTQDAAALADHTRLIHERERLSFLPGAEFFEWLLGQPGIDPAADMRVAESDEGIVGDCGTWLHTAERGARCFIWAEASPGFERLRPAMLDWTISRARLRLAEIEMGPRVIRVGVEEHRAGLRADVEAAGMTATRAFVDMARPLDDLPPLPDLPEGITVTGWSDDLEESVRITSNDAFADHWGTLPLTADEFSGFYRDNPTFRPDLSHLAIQDGRVVSFCLCEVDEEDNAERETDDVYIQRVGTLASHRGQRLATHLMIRSMQTAAEAGGLDRAALDVDEMSHTNARLVYERIGFETYARSITYVIELD